MSEEKPEAPHQPFVQRGYAFIMNIARLTDGQSYTLAPGNELRPATTQEVWSIKSAIGTLFPFPHNQFFHLWEAKLPLSGAAEFVPNPEEWRYFVLTFEGTSHSMVELQKVFDFAPTELEVGFTTLIYAGGHGISHNTSRLFHVVESRNLSFVDLSMADVVEIIRLHSFLTKHDNKSLDIASFVAQLGQLKSLPHYSPLRFLGYFGILESLLTHTPNPEDRYDSITRQVKTKLALLNARFDRKIDYSPFDGASPDTIWIKMYRYRSRIAHGDRVQFDGELSVLENHNIAMSLVKETVKSIIRQALIEPQLLLDLREC